MTRVQLLVAMLVLMATRLAVADVVHLRNGDRIEADTATEELSHLDFDWGLI